MLFHIRSRFYYVTVGIKCAVVQCSTDLLRPVEGDHFEFV